MLFFLWCLLLVSPALANTETFQVQLPGLAAPLDQHHAGAVPIGISTHPTKVHIHNVSSSLTPVTILVNNGRPGPQWYSLKVCWTAAVPLSVAAGSLSVHRHNATAAYVQFSVLSEAYPQVPLDTVVNVSLGPLFWGVVPQELLPVLGALIAVLAAVWLVHWRVVNVHSFFKWV